MRMVRRAGCVALILTFAQLIAVNVEANQRHDEQGDNTLKRRVEILENSIRDQAMELETLRQTEDDKSAPTGWGGEATRFFPSRGWLANYGVDSFNIAIHGFLNFEYVDAGPDGARDGISTFDLHHANLFFDATINKVLRTHVELEFEHSFEVVEVDQVFLEWVLDDALILTGGRFYAPFGIERFAWYPPANQLVSRPLASREIIPGNFYQQGLMVSGSLHCQCSEQIHFTYEMSLSNGLGASAATDRRGSRQTRDNNSNKAVTARVAGVFFPWIEVGASVHGGEYQDGRGDDDILFVGGDLAARLMGFELRSEFIWASVERSGTSTLRQQGWYLQLAYTQPISHPWLESVTIVGRVDRVDLDRGASGGADRLRYSIGSNFRIYDHFVAKFEYQFATENGPSKDDDAYLAALVVDF